MATPELPSNSDKSKETTAKHSSVLRRRDDGPQNPVHKKEPKVVTKVVSDDTKVVVHKKTLSDKAKDLLTGPAAKDAVNYIVHDVMIPSIKDLAFNTWTRSAERIFYGQSTPPRRYGSGGGISPRYSYNSPVRRDSYPGPMGRNPQTNRPVVHTVQRSNRLGDVIVSSHSEASLVVERLCDICDQYEFATVSDLNALLGIASNSTDTEWGWTALGGAQVRQTPDGFLVDLPDPMYLK